MPASPVNEFAVLTPGLTYTARAEAVHLAEVEASHALKNERRSLWESLVTWLALVGIAWMSEQTMAALSSLGWLMFVGMYYMPNAHKATLRTREILKIRVAFLTVEDAERFIEGITPQSLAFQMIQYRKTLPTCPM